MEMPDPLDPNIEEFLGNNMKEYLRNKEYLNNVSYRINEYGNAAITNNTAPFGNSTYISNSVGGSYTPSNTGGSSRLTTNYGSLEERSKFYWQSLAPSKWRAIDDFTRFYFQCPWCDLVIEELGYDLACQRKESGALDMNVNAAQQQLEIHEKVCSKDESSRES